MPTEIDILVKEVHGVAAQAREWGEKEIKPVKEELTRLAAGLKEAQDGIKVIQKEKLARMDSEGRMRVPEGRLAGFDMLGLRILEKVVSSRREHGLSGETLLRIVQEARANLRQSIGWDSILGWEDGNLRRRAVMAVGEPDHRAMGVFKEAIAGWTRAMVNAYQKALDSTTAASGDELVPTFEAAELWMDVNLDTLILPLLPQMAMPTNPFDIPRQFGDTNWYPSDENVQVLTTTPSTGKTTLTAYGLKTGIPFSDELEEDAVIALAAELRRSLVRNAAEIIDDVLLNGDTTVTNGINSDGATIAKTTAGKAQWLLGFDGLIHLALVDNSANQSVSVGTAVAADLYNRGLAKLGRFAVPRRRGEVVFVTDVETATRSLSIAEFETVDVAGARATLSTGEILNVYGKPSVQSEQMKMADTDGKVTDSGNATNTGRILSLNTTQWRVGFRRQITVEPDREPGKGQTTMYVSFRIALAERTGTRSTATHTSVMYGITGVSGA